jgi:hypothetical protein
MRFLTRDFVAPDEVLLADCWGTYRLGPITVNEKLTIILSGITCLFLPERKGSQELGY